ncbi:meiotic nuclear division protein 1 homolog isoform X2 [Hypanus sabinus]|nr:meiotic nuclear division protein 1 homolog isoform X2 [Hypanus sabinus]
MMEIFFETKDVFQLKDLEKIAPKEKGITSVSVKEVLQSLVDDAMVDTDRIGTSNYFWAFPSKGLHVRNQKLEKLKRQDLLPFSTNVIGTNMYHDFWLLTFPSQDIVDAFRINMDPGTREESCHPCLFLCVHRIAYLFPNYRIPYYCCHPLVSAFLSHRARLSVRGTYQEGSPPPPNSGVVIVEGFSHSGALHYLTFFLPSPDSDPYICFM